MPTAQDERLLDALLNSWDRNNSILLNLLRALPKGGLEARAMEGSPSVAELFTHIHYVRLVFVSEDAPEFASQLPEEEWVFEGDRARLVPEIVRTKIPEKRRLRPGRPFVAWRGQAPEMLMGVDERHVQRTDRIGRTRNDPSRTNNPDTMNNACRSGSVET